MAETRMINIRIPKSLLADLDAMVVKGERSAFVIAAIEEKLQRDRLMASVREMSGMIREEEAPYWSTPEKVTEWVREQRSIGSDKGIEEL